MKNLLITRKPQITATFGADEWSIADNIMQREHVAGVFNDSLEFYVNHYFEKNEIYSNMLKLFERYHQDLESIPDDFLKNVLNEIFG